MKHFFRYLSCVLFIVQPVVVFGQVQKAVLKPVSLQLQQQPLSFTPREFYIENVSDARTDRKAVAYLQLAGTTGPTPTVQPTDFEGGTINAIKQILKQGLSRNAQLRPVVVRIKTYQVKETLISKEQAEGKISVVVDFDIQRNGKTLHTLSYQGGGRYLRPLRDFSIVEPTLRKSLTDAFVYLNTWMDREADKSEKLATGVKIVCQDFTLNNDPDTVFYSSKRPVTWQDFRAQPQPGRYAAAILPDFAFTGQKEIRNGVIYVNILVKVYMVPNGSWVRAGAQNAYSLNHEQRHFDLVKIVAERFKQKLTNHKLSVDEYDNVISAQYFETLREISRIQEQYDAESGHGTDEAAQERWNRKIEEELASFVKAND